jgi:7-keto-8-aminopelargonate synthetase-like enzyme
LHAERLRREAKNRRAERLERTWREAAERDRRRAEQEEEDLAFRYNFDSNDEDGGGATPSFPDFFTVANSWEVVRAAMKAVDRQKINSEMTCRICLSGEEHRCVELTCGHYFHKFCAKQWLRKKLTCPLCNKKLVD